MTLLVDDADFRLYVGDVREQLALLPDESVHCVVTSPPYWGLRDYGTGSWDGGDPDCDHMAPPTGGPNPERYTTGGGEMFRAANDKPYSGTCGKCGATRIDQQLGLEATPELFVQNMVEVFREVRRVLRRDGTCWVNLGDSYAGGNQGGTYNPETWTEPSRPKGGGGALVTSWTTRQQRTTQSTAVSGLKPKDLCGIPWRVAFALQADGWYLRSDIVWSKPNPMPESVTDRPTKAHEYVFLLTRSPRYFFDAAAVREASITNDPRRPYTSNGAKQMDGRETWHSGERRNGDDFTGRNVRSVWEIATQPYPEAHFATFPEALPERCIKAGTSERGCCPVCGAPWARITEEDTSMADSRRGNDPSYDIPGNVGKGGRATFTSATPGFRRTITTTGWRPSCAHLRHFTNEAWKDSDPVPCTVLDPFMGSGTTALVARRLGRRSIGVELNPEYAQLCAKRLQQLSLFAGGPE